MLSFELYGTVQAVVSTLDSVNHVDGKADFMQMLSLVHNYLEPGGLFLFDVNAPYKFREIYGTNAYVLEDEGVLCAWQNLYDPQTRLCEFSPAFHRGCGRALHPPRRLRARDLLYARRDPQHAAKSGFAVISTHGDLDGSAPARDTERLYFTAKRL